MSRHLHEYFLWMQHHTMKVCVCECVRVWVCACVRVCVSVSLSLCLCLCVRSLTFPCTCTGSSIYISKILPWKMSILRISGRAGQPRFLGSAAALSFQLGKRALSSQKPPQFQRYPSTTKRAQGGTKVKPQSSAGYSFHKPLAPPVQDSFQKEEFPPVAWVCEWRACALPSACIYNFLLFPRN